MVGCNDERASLRDVFVTANFDFCDHIKECPKKQVKYGVEKSKQRTDYNLYEGWELLGYPEKVFLRGQLIVDGDNWLGRAGQGNFIKRKSGEIL